MCQKRCNHQVSPHMFVFYVCLVLSVTLSSLISVNRGQWEHLSATFEIQYNVSSLFLLLLFFLVQNQSYIFSKRCLWCPSVPTLYFYSTFWELINILKKGKIEWGHLPIGDTSKLINTERCP